MILFLAVLLFLLYWAERYSLLHVLDGVRSETKTDRVVVEPGEPFTWTMTIENRKRMMVPYLEIREQVPQGLCFAETGEPVETREGAGFRSVLYLAGQQRTELKRQVILSRRGRYFFRGSRLEAGDFLGLKTVSDSHAELAELVVKPKRLHSVKLEEMLGGFLGERPVDRSLWEDPVLTVGFREYTGREPFRSISWLQSAKTGRLVVRQYDHTLDVSCTVLFNTDASGEESMELLERCCQAARQICEELEKRKIAYDFQTNGIIAGTMGQWLAVGSGLGPGHLETVLEGLGRMTGGHRETCRDWLFRVMQGITQRAGLFLVTPRKTASIQEAVAGLEKRSGKRVFVFDASEMEDEVS